MPKAFIENLDSGDRIDVLFNPKEYTITKATPWKHHDIQGLDAPTLEFTSGEPYRCQFELFFDSYEEARALRLFRAGCGAPDRLRILGAREMTTGLDWVVPYIGD